MTVFRPIAGVITAIVAGILTNLGAARPRFDDGDERLNVDHAPANEGNHPHDSHRHGHHQVHDDGHQHDRPLVAKLAGGPAPRVLASVIYLMMSPGGLPSDWCSQPWWKSLCRHVYLRARGAAERCRCC